MDIWVNVIAPMFLTCLCADCILAATRLRRTCSRFYKSQQMSRLCQLVKYRCAMDHSIRLLDLLQSFIKGCNELPELVVHSDFYDEFADIIRCSWVSFDSGDMIERDTKENQERHLDFLFELVLFIYSASYDTTGSSARQNCRPLALPEPTTRPQWKELRRRLGEWCFRFMHRPSTVLIRRLYRDERCTSMFCYLNQCIRHHRQLSFCSEVLCAKAHRWCKYREPCLRDSATSRTNDSQPLAHDNPREEEEDFEFWSSLEHMVSSTKNKRNSGEIE